MGDVILSTDDGKQLCIGDTVTIYAEHTAGYVYATMSR